ncbi:hypothetical protein [uncultured Novosphingobium sp.]|uniref:hypothetical protein n=1 Tax=uncultured Novosphingobium sp. TaxID=292277 RepID=UPI002588F7A3|nr:hypothetical protein [uncultured Novosphingobium sp.]
MTSTAQPAIRWTAVADLPDHPEYGSYLVWVTGMGARDAQWLPEGAGGWLIERRLVHRNVASHFARINEPEG